MSIAFIPLPTDIVRRYQAGGPDANGQTPERAVSDGPGTPCRHCLKNIPEGEGMLILAHRPFPAPQPYAELGPIFLCADAERCHAPQPSDALPEVLASPEYIVRGYSARAPDRLWHRRSGADRADRRRRRRRGWRMRGWPMCMSARRGTTAIRCASTECRTQNSSKSFAKFLRRNLAPLSTSKRRGSQPRLRLSDTSAMRFARVAGVFAVLIHSSVPRLTERGHAFPAVTQ